MATCVEEVALKTLPKKQKSKPKQLSTHNAVIKARSELKTASNNLENSASDTNKDRVKKAKNNLQIAYDTATAEYIQGQINNISNKHYSQKHSAAWKTINEITGRKDKPTVIVKGGTAEKRKEGWLNHFKKLLGESPEIQSGIPKV